MYKVRLLGKREIASGTMEFRFGRPAGFEYQAGQTVDLTLIKPPETDDEGSMRTFSLVSAPHEADLRIATRLRDTAFKRVLKALPEGSEISLKGPFGSFTLHENIERPAVFLAGGIGITPFHSIITDASERKLPHSLFLFFSNRRPEDAPFLHDFEELEKQNANLKLIATMTDDASWQGERGYITHEMLLRYLPADTNPIFYIAGPQGMVTAMRDMLIKNNVSSDDIRIEQFAGY